MNAVKAWQETIVLPTYETGIPEKNPIFLEKRVYQGSSGVVYPHPVIEKISDTKTDKPYQAFFLENAFLKIMILPQLGGRIHRAYDKVRQRDFIYYNQVIKPALVGLTGPWISGGIEFNWPQHHRPSTYEPVDCTIEEHADGSKTVWVNEVEIMFRTKGMAGFTLYPDKAYLEVKGKLHNRTPFPQTFLWWANPAVKVNDHYQSVFPPDVYAVFDHGKRDVSDFPIATGAYYKVNYAPGTDISRYKNIPVPTSYMAIKSEYDFIGCYEHNTRAGMLHVANHHIAPGKKQWTWGNGDFGQAWDRNLTDEDGPYIELMTGVFTDNQPDFSWLMPNEEKTFEQYFLPYAEIGVVKNATKEALVNLEVEEKRISVQVFATGVYPAASVCLYHGGQLLQQYQADLAPEQPFKTLLPLDSAVEPQDIKVIVKDQDSNELVSYQPQKFSEQPLPPPATAARPPAEIESVEELFLNGLHLEQYRHATFSPTDYYEEGLQRDPGDVRCNNALGLLFLRRGQFEKAVPYFEKAIERLTLRNPNPYDGEPFYNLGWACLLQGKYDEAYNAFYKASWNDAWQHSAFLSLARVAAHKQQWTDALYLIGKSLNRNANSAPARHLNAVLLRKLGKGKEALAFTRESLSMDPFNFGCHFEQYLLLQEESPQQAPAALATLTGLMRDALHNYLEYSLDYAHVGLYTEASDLLLVYGKEKTAVSPLVYYYLGWFAAQSGAVVDAAKYFEKAAGESPHFCFPSKVEEVLILKKALTCHPGDAKGWYYLGNYWYARRVYDEAITCWEQSAALDASFPTVFRNLSLAYFNKQKNTAKALTALEKAFALDRTDSRVLMELDQLYKLLNKAPAQRLALLERHLDLVSERDDLYLERVTLYNQLDEYGKARELLAARTFHPWEGGEGKTVGQYWLCHMELAKKALLHQDYREALQLLDAVSIYPQNLGEGKLYGTQENDVHYLKGCAYEGLGLSDEASKSFAKATIGISEPVQAIFYNDPQPDKIFYQGLSWLKLGEEDKARQIFQRFISFGEQHLEDEIRIDYFAVSLPDLLVFDQDLNVRNVIHCHYLVGLGYLGLGEYEKAAGYLTTVLASNVNHLGAATHRNMIDFLKKQQGAAKIAAAGE